MAFAIAAFNCTTCACVAVNPCSAFCKRAWISFASAAQRWRMQRRIAQRGGERDVNFVIGQANRFRREFLFSRQRRQRRKLLRDFRGV